MTDDQQLKAPENDWMSAWRRKDKVALESILAPDYCFMVSTDPTRSYTREEWLDPGPRRLFVSVVQLRCRVSADPGALRDRYLAIPSRGVSRRGRPKPRLLSDGHMAADRQDLACSSATFSLAGTCE